LNVDLRGADCIQQQASSLHTQFYCQDGCKILSAIEDASQ
jgi:hypothetical protein